MKKLMTLALIALLSFGVASVSWAQDPAGGQAAGGEMKSGTEKTPKAKKKKKSKKSKKTKTPAAATQ